MWSKHPSHTHVRTSFPTIAIQTQSSASHSVDSVEPYLLLQHSGQPSADGWPHSHMTLATDSVCAINTDTGPSERYGLVWMIEQPRTLPISGIYDRHVNGVFDCKVVVLTQENSFVFARTRDSTIEQLKARLDELVGSSS